MAIGNKLGTSPILISTPQWPHRPCIALMQFYRVAKKPSVKADQAIYSHVVDACGQCMNVSLMLGFKLDFSSCAIWDGFCEFSHIYMHIFTHRYKCHVRINYAYHIYVYIHTYSPTHIHEYNPMCAHTQITHTQTDKQTDRWRNRQIDIQSCNSLVSKHTQLIDLISYNSCLVWISLSYHPLHRMPLSYQTTKQNTSTRHY